MTNEKADDGLPSDEELQLKALEVLALPEKERAKMLASINKFPLGLKGKFTAAFESIPDGFVLMAASSQEDKTAFAQVMATMSDAEKKSMFNNFDEAKFRKLQGLAADARKPKPAPKVSAPVPKKAAPAA